jgi:hypothetical protein
LGILRLGLYYDGNPDTLGFTKGGITMMHLHTLVLDVPRSNRVFCTGCDVKLRLATGDEARFVHMTGCLLDDGPLIWENGVVVVPYDYSLWKRDDAD